MYNTSDILLPLFALHLNAKDPDEDADYTNDDMNEDKGQHFRNSWVRHY